ncbi:MAG: exodeoxyribonuclease VII small subunit [Oscillospiraceae bacterium]|nr:exodeoxyribonuclease VII small subunit [Oscillospiraceae bacterium]
MNFEEGMQQLAEITAKLEAGGLPLEEAVALYGDGAKLAAACRRELEQAKLKVSEYDSGTKQETFINTEEDGNS